MRLIPYMIYTVFLAVGLSRFFWRTHDRMSFHWLLQTYGGLYSTVRVALAFTVTYSHMRNGMLVHSISHISRSRVRDFRYKGYLPSKSLVRLVANEMHLRTRVDHGKVISYDVVWVNINAVHMFLQNDESDIPKDVIAEVDRIEDIFMKLPRTIK